VKIAVELFLVGVGGHEEFFAEKTHCVSEVGDALPLKFWTRDGDFGEQVLVFEWLAAISTGDKSIIL
jgi:hypothetical protein